MGLYRKSSSYIRMISRAAKEIASADGILITAGAGMGVDSGLPDFRSKDGFWNAYPSLKSKRIGFQQMATPDWFDTDPSMAWAFYGHRFNLYQETVPHEGFGILKKWASLMEYGAFVFTSNVDGQFQRAGFSPERICECHGSINQLQCSKPCDGIWSHEGLGFDVDLESLSVSGVMPVCKCCGSVARPNIKMFNDWSWLPGCSKAQKIELSVWLEKFDSHKLVVLEVGAGSSVPTVRWHSQIYSEVYDAPLIRINPTESQGPRRTIALPMGGLEALKEIDGLISR